MRLLFVLLAAAALWAQDPAPDAARFEVASIKPAAIGDRTGNFPSPGTLRIGNLTLRQMITQSSRVQSYQVVGGPAWIDTDRFNIDAKASFPAKMDQMMKMLGPLLEERFQLKVHRETRDVPGFALVVAKGGPKMAASDQPGVGSWRERRNEITSFSLDMKMLAYILAGSLGSPVADATGLTGTYKFTLEYDADFGRADAASGATSSDAPSSKAAS